MSNYTVPFVRIFEDPVEQLEIQNANAQKSNAVDYFSIDSDSTAYVENQYKNSINATDQYINASEQYIPPRNI